MADHYEPLTQELISAIEAGSIPSCKGYLVGLDRPTLLSPDPAALLVAERGEDILASGHRWRVVTRALRDNLLALGRERPTQAVHVLSLADVDVWLEGRGSLADLDRDCWRGDQGTTYIVPILEDR